MQVSNHNTLLVFVFLERSNLNKMATLTELEKSADSAFLTTSDQSMGGSPSKGGISATSYKIVACVTIMYTTLIKIMQFLSMCHKSSLL